MSELEHVNIFDAITYDSEEANELQTSAELMIVIRYIFNDSGLGKSEFAEKIGLSQPRTSNLFNGHIDKFDINLLMTCLFRLGYMSTPHRVPNLSRRSRHGAVS